MIIRMMEKTRRVVKESVEVDFENIFSEENAQ